MPFLSFSRICLAFVIFSLVCAPAFAGLRDALDADQIKQLEAGESVTVLNKIEGATWPEIKIYREVNASPAQVADLFTDYEKAPTYIPNMLKAEVIGDLNSKSTDVQYTVKFPILSKVSYVVRNQYAQKGDTYRVSWTLVKSSLAKSSTGSLEVEPMGNHTIFCYTNLAEPITKLAAGLKNQAVGEAQATVEAIAKEAEKRAAAARVQ